MDNEQLNLEEFGEAIGNLAKALGELIREVAEKIMELIGKPKNKVKYKPVKSLIKPYKQPFIKVRYRARANL